MHEKSFIICVSIGYHSNFVFCFFFLSLFLIYRAAYLCVSAVACVCRSENDFVESVTSSLPYVGSGVELGCMAGTFTQ